jgi:hypothetical protein
VRRYVDNLIQTVDLYSIGQEDEDCTLFISESSWDADNIMHK